MNRLRPTLWRTCRVIANEQRMLLLYSLFKNNGQCVFELAQNIGIRPEHASIHLRSLNSRGLILQKREKMRLLCSTQANEEVDSAPLLLNALRTCYKQQTPTHVLTKQATAFTHARRIEIIRCIPSAGITKDQLNEQTNISYSALTRHLNKLESRGFITSGRNIFFRATPPDALSKALLKVILNTK